MILYLTSSPTGIYRSDREPGIPGVNPANHFADHLREDWKTESRCLLISAFPDSFESNNLCRDHFYDRLIGTGLSISCFDICDNRNPQVIENIASYDFLLLGGGHVPTQLAFFKMLRLKERIQHFDGIVMGISAGTMNCAEIVYAQPEEPGEAVNPEYQRFVPGLGLTTINILPHYQAVKNDWIDGKRLFEDITLPDSHGHIFYAIPDGSYVRQDSKGARLYGSGYRISNGTMCEIADRIL